MIIRQGLYPLLNQEPDDTKLTSADALSKLNKYSANATWFFKGLKITFAIGVAAGVAGFCYSIVKFAISDYRSNIKDLQNQFHMTETSHPYGSVNLGTPDDPARFGTNITCYEYLYSEDMLYDSAALAFNCHPDSMRCPLSTCSFIQEEEPQCRIIHEDLDKERCERAVTLAIMSTMPMGVIPLLFLLGSAHLAEIYKKKRMKIQDIPNEKFIANLYSLYREMNFNNQMNIHEFKNTSISNVVTFFSNKSSSNRVADPRSFLTLAS